MSRRRHLEFSLATGIRPLAGAWQRLADAALATLGISNSQGWALVHLARLGSNARQADLARAIMQPAADGKGPVDYKIHVGGVMVARAMKRAATRAA